MPRTQRNDNLSKASQSWQILFEFCLPIKKKAKEALSITVTACRLRQMETTPKLDNYNEALELEDDPLIVATFSTTSPDPCQQW